MEASWCRGRKKEKKNLIAVTLSVTLTHVDGGHKPSENCFLFQQRNKGFDSITSQSIWTDHMCLYTDNLFLLFYCVTAPPGYTFYYLTLLSCVSIVFYSCILAAALFNVLIIIRFCFTCTIFLCSCLLVGWQRPLDGFPRNLDGGWVVVQNRTHYLQAQIRIKKQM